MRPAVVVALNVRSDLVWINHHAFEGVARGKEQGWPRGLAVHALTQLFAFFGHRLDRYRVPCRAKSVDRDLPLAANGSCAGDRIIQRGLATDPIGGEPVQR